MQTRWFSNQPKEQQPQIKQMVLGSKKVLDILDGILYNISIEVEVPSPDDYNSPSWAYKQADRIGYLRALKEVRQIIQVDDKST